MTYLANQPPPDPHQMAQTTLIYSDNGRVLQPLGDENRISVTYDQIPKVVVDAVISTEDRHFFHEGPINLISTLRALASDLSGSGGLQGGSTITQQYVKQTYLNAERTIGRKISEAFIAIKIAHTMTKKEILAGYLNTIYFGRGAYGIEAAAETYFGTTVEHLDLADASLLAAMIKNPGQIDPATDPKSARFNQNVTLQAMVRDNQISQAQANTVKKTPFSAYVRADNPDSDINIPTYHVYGDQYFLQAVYNELIAAYGQKMVMTGGLRVTTTLNPAIQDADYKAVYGKGPNALNPANGDPSGAMVTVTDNGEVKGMIGGQLYGSNGSDVNLAMGAEGGGSGRQAGSTFKAFLLAYLIKHGYSVESQFSAPPKIIIRDGSGSPEDPKNWNVGNDEGEASTAKVSIVDATAQSLNTVYAQIVAALGAPALYQMAEAMGIPKQVLGAPVLSAVLGVRSVSPLQMASAYSTFADGGEWNSPILITKVTTATGKVLPLPKQTHRRVLTPAEDALEDYVLQQVIASGTGSLNAGNIGSPAAGKTGTTNNNADAWFIGFTPKITSAVWMGYARGEVPMVNWRGLQYVNGGNTPTQIWHDAMTQILAEFPQYKAAFPGVTYSELEAGKILNKPASAVIPAPTTTTTVPPTTTTTTPAGKSSVSTTTPTTTPSATTAPPST